MKNVLTNVVVGVISIVIALLFLPLLQEGIDALTGTGMVYENTATGTILTILPVVVVSGITFSAIKTFLNK